MDENEEISNCSPLDIVREYITKDVRERSELSARTIYAFSHLRAIALELNWEWTLEVIDEYLHLMRSNRRQGIKEDISLLTGFTVPLGEELPEKTEKAPLVEQK